jgi:HNH endonuclease
MTPTQGFNKTLGRWTVYVHGRSQYRYRWLMEQHLGRELRTDEHVHHINEDPTDDRLENLKVLGEKEHTKLHSVVAAARRLAAREHAWSDEFPGCVECETTDRRHIGHGLCSRCYYRIYQRQTKGHEPRKAAIVLDLVCSECARPFQRTLKQGRREFCSRSCASRKSARKRWARRNAGDMSAIGKSRARTDAHAATPMEGTEVESAP